MGEMRRAIEREEQDRRKQQDRFASTLVIAAAIIAAVRLAREPDITRLYLTHLSLIPVIQLTPKLPKNNRHLDRSTAKTFEISIQVSLLSIDKPHQTEKYLSRSR
jgi:hypothetical protein